ncbi:DUF2812 domain-containing protein [Sporosarcina sp. FA9]|uniref:DUF2812 domain-containing protein n=1 Tax=Sporosarcina sp. FA9 TaxID=3413030 RepID=UPI003F65800F
MIKKWRPFWSYDVEKTEHWLAEMAAEGKKVVQVNLITRFFAFEEAVSAKVEYQIIYDKLKSPLTRTLEKSGWKSRVEEGNWRFVENAKDAIRAYPVRDGILKRNKLHATVATGVSFFSGAQALFMLLLLLILLTSGEGFEGSGPFGIIVSAHLTQSVVIMFLAIYLKKKIRAFEHNYFNTGEDVLNTTGETFSIWKLSWAETPDLLEDWLSDMALRGNHFVRIGKQNGRFNFEKGEPKHVSYVYDYQLKASSLYYDLHKSEGWKLKYTSTFSITKQSIWMKEYKPGEKKPQFTYDPVEEKKRIRKVIIGNALSILFPVAISTFLLWIGIPFYKEEGLTLLIQFLIGVIILSMALPIRLVYRTIRYGLRMRHKLTNPHRI